MKGVIGFGFVTSWVFGREYSYRIIKNMLTLSISRYIIVLSKFIAAAIWCFLIIYKSTSTYSANKAFFRDYPENNCNSQSDVLCFRSSKILWIREYYYRSLIYHSDLSRDHFLPVHIRLEPLNPLYNHEETFSPADAHCASLRIFLP
ncbi:MAG: ABC transporter permease [Actinobacteria bacterium]|nr:ABC transporter permease [Actinomycetota bacterium]MBL7123484.1 ABC transporter permease [Actinomycetota bacterium]